MSCPPRAPQSRSRLSGWLASATRALLVLLTAAALPLLAQDQAPLTVPTADAPAVQAAAAPAAAHAAPVHMGGEASLKLPSLDNTTKVVGGKVVPWGDTQPVTFLGGMTGRSLLMWGLLICALGFAFGIGMYAKVKSLPVHKSMLEVSELIYATCKAYLVTQVKFLGILWLLIAAVMVAYFGFLTPSGETTPAGEMIYGLGIGKVTMILGVRA